MKNLFYYLIISSFIFFGCQNNSSDLSIEWVSSNPEAQWVVKNVTLKQSQQNTEATINVFTDSVEQTIDGFGGCFNELGWEALNVLPENEQDEILESLFNTTNGCKFNICRMPIGANDYAVDWYSHNETPEDFEMENFSISRDKQRLIPYIKEAMKINPEITLWASPWCPPSWMKKNKHYACRADSLVNDLDPALNYVEELVTAFIMEPEYLEAYATYFAKFIEAYQEEGLAISSVHVQNEPNSGQTFPACVWKPKDLGIFIADYLYPEFEENEINSEIWLGTIERPHPERVDSALLYKNVRNIVEGVGFQWAGKGAIPYVNKAYPELKLMQTETECGDGSNNWESAKYTFELMKHYFKHGANTYLYWNMVLDETGKSQWGWKQNSMISIDKGTKAVTYNPEFYLMKHFSAFVASGYQYVKTSDENCLAFKKGNEFVLIYYNESPEEVSRQFTIGDAKFQVSVKSESYNTLIINT